MYSAVSDRYADRFPVPPLYGPGLTVAVSPTGDQAHRRPPRRAALGRAGHLRRPVERRPLRARPPGEPARLRAADPGAAPGGRRDADRASARPTPASRSRASPTSTSAYAGSGGDGLIRLADTSDPPTAYTYLPDDNPYGGDVFFGHSGRAPVAGNYDYFTVLHELGHALGLKHGNEATGFGALPAEDGLHGVLGDDLPLLRRLERRAAQRALGLCPDLHDVRHRRAAVALRRRLHHQRRRHHLRLVAGRRRHLRRRRGGDRAAGQPDLRHHLGRRRPRRLRPVRLRHRRRRRPRRRAAPRPSPPTSSPASAAAPTTATPAATSSTPCSSRATRAR